MKFSPPAEKNPDKSRLRNLLSIFRYAFLVSVLSLSCLETPRLAAARLPQDEVDALNLITKKMGANGWNFNADSCGEYLPRVQRTDPDRNITCDCRFENNTCHITSLYFKRFNLAGELPPELIQLRYLKNIDLSYNYLSGSIPSQWASLQLEMMILSSNKLDGNLPKELAELKNLIDFRINDNNFNGSIPDFVQNWKQIKRLEMVASGLEGPIPPSISVLETLTDLRISDLNGPTQGFPMLITMTGMIRLILRNCNISGELPAYLWTMKSLEVLDVSFNKLVGKIPDTISADRLRFVFLTGNLLSGDVPDSILRNGINVDLSYNNFAFQGPEQPVCQENLNLNLNLFRSSSMGNNSRRILPCKRTFSCPKYSNCLHVNAGGKDVIIKENKTTLSYEGDGQEEGGAAKYFLNEQSFWGFSSSGDFMDDYDYQNIRYTETRWISWRFDRWLRIPAYLTPVGGSDSDLKLCSSGKKKGTAYVVAGAVAAACLIATILGILWWRGNLPGKWCRKKGNAYSDLC
ncbi:LRR RECEPTOR-LIKE SERINE/THREONINE-PROTEIN KINASE RFK1-RELATED [Salix purpurea]|uniref:LRR RECEPTOR-LIKE SERINE/THREONINE-PROTEIN KINASE RFK1-RELATED n=1 Tax=Salix purpurea TaxID=77065 RepID=A0A9Q0WH45_SALPP|nr:LRR RECEPTOR-LIKE SERINE/THREONINE-PROTEIN KINASE RFK1-RELATED [Salix purpurea]